MIVPVLLAALLPAAPLLSDFYLFKSPDNPNTVTLIATLAPHDPASPPEFDDALHYTLAIDSNGDAIADLVYELAFTTHLVRPDSILYAQAITQLSPPSLGWFHYQTVTVRQIDRIAGTVQVVLQDGIVAPPDIGQTTGGYAALIGPAIHDVVIPGPGGGAGRIFCGPRDDPAFLDSGALLDDFLIRPTFPGDMGGGVDARSGLNVLAIVLQLPIRSVTVDRSLPSTGGTTGAIIGAWAAIERRKVEIHRDGKTSGHGPWVQIARAGIPLFDTLLLPAGQRIAQQSAPPVLDAATLPPLLLSPELPGELQRVYPALYTPPLPPRSDLVGLLAGNLLLGLSASDPGRLLAPADILRLDVTEPASPLDGSANRRGALAGEPGFPHGRRLDDDSTDILIGIAGGALLGPPVSTSDNARFGDGVDQNDVAFEPSFPYLAPPHRARDQGLHTMPPAH